MNALLDVLAAREAENMRVVNSVHGLIEDQELLLESLGVYDEYKAIHAAYAQLVGAESSHEALKRALFIQWFYLTEPAFLSGIGEVDQQAELAVLTQLEHLLLTRQADAELATMLGYYATWEYVFQRPEFLHLTALQAFVAARMTSDASSTAQSNRLGEMTGRGQMGTYWQSRNRSKLWETA